MGTVRTRLTVAPVVLFVAICAAWPGVCSAAARGSLAGRTIVIDPGHNGGNATHPREIGRLVPAGGFRKACDTTGTATNAGYAEHAFTWDVSQRLARILRGRGARVVLTRASDRGVGPCVDIRGQSGQRARADLAVSVHADGGPASGRGFHVITPARVSFPGGSTANITRPSKALALRLRARLDRCGLPRSNYAGSNAISVRGDLAGLNLSAVPKVLVELGNMRNAADARLQTSAAWRQRIAHALADGIDDSL
jgi:N-acetylmuramoyl-L-alanine amidase